MKSLFLTLCLIVGIAFNAQAQKMAAQLQSKSWFVNGTIGSGSLILKTTQGKTPSDWEAKFLTSGSMEHCSTINADLIDATGITIKAGTFYCDPYFVYTVKNDMISIMKDDKTYFYKIVALPNSEGIEFTPSTTKEFQ